jgi:hypothetical protein
MAAHRRGHGRRASASVWQNKAIPENASDFNMPCGACRMGLWMGPAAFAAATKPSQKSQ